MDKRYEYIRNRIQKVTHNRDISDRDIILELDKEINYYRERIENLIESNETNKENKVVEETVYKYAGGKLIMSTTKYKYEEESTCPEIIPELYPSG